MTDYGSIVRPYLPTKHSVDKVNSWLAVNITDGVATMWCAYLFTVIALVSLPATLVAAGWVGRSAFPSWLVGEGVISFIGWVSSYFIQLVLLSVIMVGQKVGSRQAEDVKQRLAILDRLDVATPGGLESLEEHLARQDETQGKLVEAVDDLRQKVQEISSRNVRRPWRP
jgi:hypothetical protein